MKNLICCVFIFVTFCNLRADEIIKKGEVLDLNKCISIALKYSPIITGAVNTVAVNESLVGQATSGYYPQITGTAGYSRNSLAGSGGSSTGTSNEYSAGVSLQQNIYDFGKTSSQVNIAKYNTNASSALLYNTRQQVIFNVTQAYFTVLQDTQIKEVDEEIIKADQDTLDQAQAQYNVGTKAMIDVTNAEVSLSNDQFSLLNAENSLNLAIVNLNANMGITDAPEYRIEGTLSFEKYNISLDNAMQTAFANRQDLKSIYFQETAAQYNEEFVKTGYYPSIGGSVGYSWIGEGSPFSSNNGWDALLTLSMPIFNGGLTKYKIIEAQANLDVLKSSEEGLKQTVFSGVKQAYLNLQSGEQQIQVANVAVEQAKQNSDIAQGSYKVGVATYLQVTDARVAYSTAQKNYIQAIYNYKISEAAMKEAMGVIQ